MFHLLVSPPHLRHSYDGLEWLNWHLKAYLGVSCRLTESICGEQAQDQAGGDEQHLLWCTEGMTGNVGNSIKIYSFWSLSVL